jgi:hypothetical protein
LNIIRDVQGCDARDDDSSNTAKDKKSKKQERRSEKGNLAQHETGNANEKPETRNAFEKPK